MTTIAKATTKGQITLPAKWRKNFSTNQYLLIERKNSLEIKPVELEKLTSKTEYTVFDAIRDNNGKGLAADDLVKILKDLNG